MSQYQKTSFLAATCLLAALAATQLMPVYQVHSQSQQAIAQCGQGQVLWVHRHDFACR